MTVEIGYGDIDAVSLLLHTAYREGTHVGCPCLEGNGIWYIQKEVVEVAYELSTFIREAVEYLACTCHVLFGDPPLARECRNEHLHVTDLARGEGLAELRD